MQDALKLPDSYDPAVVLTAFAGFIRWASMYGHQIQESSCLTDRILAAGSPVVLELSVALSASINFGYIPKDDSTVYMAVDSEEYEWLPKMPISEVVVGIDKVYVLTAAYECDGELLDAMAIAVRTDQSMLWRAFAEAKEVGFMCVKHSDAGMEVTDIDLGRYPLRFLND